ncbi:MAG: ureidoglycolate lyase [Rhizobiales bacterium]|nr:ureidoglycolate lyase [Hyphomicrobiales bacterium]
MSNPKPLILTPKPLTQQAFAPFGDVIEMDEDKSYLINQDMTRRYHKLATSDTDTQNGSSIISIFKSKRWQFPLQILMMEKHPLGSQAFLPMQGHNWLIVVATGNVPTAQTCQAFIATGVQGVQYNKGVWHHPLLTLAEQQNFWIVDRDGAGENLIEHHFEGQTAQVDIRPVES